MKELSILCLEIEGVRQNNQWIIESYTIPESIFAKLTSQIHVFEWQVRKIDAFFLASSYISIKI